MLKAKHNFKDSTKAMFKNLKTLIISVAAVLTITAPLAATAIVSAAPNIGGNLCGGANLGTDESNECKTSTGSFAAILANIINVLSLIVGIVAVVMIIIAGFNYITSNGEDAKVSTAKKAIVNAIVGLIIVASAQVIVKFVLNKGTI